MNTPSDIPGWTTDAEPTSWFEYDSGYSQKVSQRGSQPVEAQLGYHYMDIFMVSDLIWAYHKEYKDITQVYQIGESNDGLG